LKVTSTLELDAVVAIEVLVTLDEKSTPALMLLFTFMPRPPHRVSIFLGLEQDFGL
jgi:hypothetical protein